MRRFLTLIVPALLIGLVPPLLTVPFIEYAERLFAALVLIVLMALLCLISSSGDLIAARRQHADARSLISIAVRPRAIRAVAIVGALAIAGIIYAHVAAPEIEREAAQWGATKLTAPPQ
jgi:hypothetical protein